MALSARQKDHKQACKERVSLQKLMNKQVMEDASDEDILKTVVKIRAMSNRIRNMKDVMGIPA